MVDKLFLTKKMAAGGELKKVPEDKTGLSKLPTEVRNKMGYMKEGGEAKSIVIDVTNQKVLMTAYAQIEAVHILVNCAGISHIGNATSTEEQDFEKIFNVNVKGVYNSLHAAIPIIQKSGGGAIVNISSLLPRWACRTALLMG